MRHLACLSLTLLLLVANSLPAQQDLADKLSKSFTPTFADDKQAQQALRDHAWEAMRARRHAINLESTARWHEVKTLKQWQALRDECIGKLAASLGQAPGQKRDVKPMVTGKRLVDGVIIENIVFESQPGLVVTANLYSPVKRSGSMPGILIFSSHHNPKTQGELQDMGILWARLGCLVIVPDQLGHGERRAHPFTDSSKYPGSFGVGRQDYYFRYNTAMQLHLVGESLMGYMVRDMMGCVDVLYQQPGIDKKRIILLGSVAGGGDPAAVTAALDPRISAAVPFNFGGPQPETVFPLPKDPENRFNYMGGGSWESTRNLRMSGRDGFLPWMIVAATAPRPLIYAHEFAWDREHDPVWNRLQQLYSLHNKPGNLAFTFGKGSVKGRPPTSTHCNNIGAYHRKLIYAALEKWFGIPAPEKENEVRVPSEYLQCLTPAAKKKLQPRKLHEIASEMAASRLQKARKQRKDKQALAAQWRDLLGMSKNLPKYELTGHVVRVKVGDVETTLHTIRHQEVPYPAEEFPFLLLVPASSGAKKLPVVIGLAQKGRQGFLQHRSEEIAGLLQKGFAVCLPDLRASGELGFTDVSRRSSLTSLSSAERMLGRTLLGTRLQELDMLLQVLRSGKVVNAGKIVLWGDSFAQVNVDKTILAVPLDADKMPHIARPQGGVLALLGALLDDDIAGVYVRGGLVSFASILDSQFIYVPHDCAIPGALAVSDLNDIAAELAPRPVHLEALVTGMNQRARRQTMADTYTSRNVTVAEQPSNAAGLVGWMKSRVAAK